MQRSLLFGLLMYFGPALAAQSSEGTAFWGAFLKNLDLPFNDDPVFTLQIAAETAASGALTVPATGLTIPFSAAGGSVTELVFPDAAWYSEGSEAVDNKGFLLTADAPVRVTAFHYRAYFTESTLLLPEPALGTEYIATCYEDEDGSSPSALVVVSTEDDNTVEIIPSTLTQGLRPPGVPFTVALNRGQTYQILANGDLTGAEIRSLSGKKLAVFSGAKQADVEQCFGGADSHLYDQCVPTPQWDDLYYHVPFSGQGGDPVRVVAADANTTVFFDCQPVATLGRGEFYQQKLFQPTVISATGAVAVTQFNSSQSCNPSGIGDPNQLRLLPTRQQLSSVQWRAPGNTSGLGFPYVSAHFVNVVTAAGAAAGMRLDGADISAEFSPFPADPGQVYARLSVEAGLHQLTGETGAFSAYAYGFGDFDAYTFHLGYAGPEEVTFNCLDIQVDGLFCVDSLLDFSVLTSLDLVEYEWDFGNGQTSDSAAPAISYDAIGPYTVLLNGIDGDGNAVTASLDLAILDCPENPCEETPVVVLLSDPDSPCAGEPVSFSTSSDFLYPNQFWSFGTAGVATGVNPEVIFDAPGEYQITFTLFDQFNCPYIYNETVVVEECNFCDLDPEQEIFIDGALCIDSMLTFSTAADLSLFPTAAFQWIFSDGQTFSGTSPEVVFEEPGVYILEFAGFDLFAGCSIFGVAEFVVQDCENIDPCLDLPAVNLSISGAFCADSLLVFSVNTSAELVSYQWEASNGETGAAPVFSTAFEGAGVFGLSFTALDNNDCSYEESIAFDIEDCSDDDPCVDLPEVTLTVEGALCVDSVLQLGAATTADLLSFEWDLGEGVTSTVAAPERVFGAPGGYVVTLNATDGAGCTYQAFIELTVQSCVADPCVDLPALNIQGEASPCQGEPVAWQVENADGLVAFTWDFGPAGIFQEAAPVVTFSDTGRFDLVLVAVDEAGCFYEETFPVAVSNCDCRLGLPNAFSPNEDGVNDRFAALFNCPLASFELRIFNRWGGVVYESADPSAGWDGRFNGRPVNSDVYVWMLRYRFEAENDFRDDAGEVVLLR